MPKPIINLIIMSSFIAILVLSSSGCTTPLNHIGAFSKATADLSKQAASAYEKVNETTIERRINGIAAEVGTSPDDDTFNKLIGGTNLEVRVALLRGIEKYADALGDLASADFRKDIDAATKDLYGALGNLQKSYMAATKSQAPLTNDNLAIIATAVDAIGTTIVEERRRDALRTVVIQANPTIQKSMELFKKELPMLKELIMLNLDTIYTEKVKAYQKEGKNVNFEKRVGMLREIRSSYDQMEASKILIENLSIAATRISDAHNILYVTVEKNEFTSKELVNEIKKMAELAKTIKEFNEELKEQ